MTPESIDNFLSLYLRSLLEESRQVKAGPRFGFDRVIHQLAIADGCFAVRLPFFREASKGIPKPKKEAEHGVDMSFLTKDRKTLIVFVLKDEALTYRNFIENDFDKDIRLAAAPDVDDPLLAGVEAIQVILAYNKDDDEEGVENFKRLVKTLGTKVADRINLSFDRWNLSRVTELVTEKLLTPSLLPENFFRNFSYICAQFNDFDATSPHWKEILVPDWKEFLTEILSPPVKETNIRLASIALIVLRQHAKTDGKGAESQGAQIGWIELVEWAMLALWKSVHDAPKKDTKKLKQVVMEFWLTFYLAELQSFYKKNGGFLQAEHALELSGEVIEDAGNSYRVHWHLGRLGILSMAISELTAGANEDQLVAEIEWLQEINGWIVGLLNASPSCYRPMLDIQHIEQFLVWRSLAQFGRWSDINRWIVQLTDRIYLRFIGGCEIPGIDYRNSWDLLMESLSGDDPLNSVSTESSYLILMLMELCLGFPDGRGDELIKTLHQLFVQNPAGKSEGLRESSGSLDLISWSQPADWGVRALCGDHEGGYGITVVLDRDNPAESLRDFIAQSKNTEIDRFDPPELPSVIVLACLRNGIPLAPFFWRSMFERRKPQATKAQVKKRSTSKSAKNIQSRKTR